MKRIILLSFITVLCVTLFSQIPSYVPTTGLIGWYPFTGNSNDLSGHSLNGTVNGVVLLTTDRFGNSNSSYSFDGSTGYISVSSDSLLTLTNQYSISCWFYPTVIQGHQRTMVSQSRSNISTGLCLNLDDLQNYQVWCDNTDNNGTHTVPSSFLPLVNTWYNSVITYDGTTEKIYINGVIDTSRTLTINLSNQNILTIGSQHITGYTDFFSGKLDDIGVWNRSLTPTEVMGLYNSPNPNGINTINTNEISVYPNPTNNYITINIGNLTGEYSLKIVNTLSQIVYQSSINQSVSQVDLSGKSKGIYLVEILDNTNSVIETKKIILN